MNTQSCCQILNKIFDSFNYEFKLLNEWEIKRGIKTGDHKFEF